MLPLLRIGFAYLAHLERRYSSFSLVKKKTKEKRQALPASLEDKFGHRGERAMRLCVRDRVKY
jgi:hypothetical protein